VVGCGRKGRDRRRCGASTHDRRTWSITHFLLDPSPPGFGESPHDRIASTLAAAKRVRAPSEWNGLPVNTAAGLEAGLIELIGPIWNILGVQ
jgi:hypothetical protein